MVGFVTGGDGTDSVVAGGGGVGAGGGGVGAGGSADTGVVATVAEGAALDGCGCWGGERL